MNIFDYIQQCGKCKTACGWDFDLAYTILSDSETYRIVGYVTLPNGHRSMYKWDIDGNVENKPSNHGLDLVPAIPVTKYVSVDKNELSRFNKSSEFIKSMLAEYI